MSRRRSGSLISTTVSTSARVNFWSLAPSNRMYRHEDWMRLEGQKLVRIPNDKCRHLVSHLEFVGFRYVGVGVERKYYRGLFFLSFFISVAVIR